MENESKIVCQLKRAKGSMRDKLGTGEQGTGLEEARDDAQITSGGRKPILLLLLYPPTMNLSKWPRIVKETEQRGHC